MSSGGKLSLVLTIHSPSVSKRMKMPAASNRCSLMEAVKILDSSSMPSRAMAMLMKRWVDEMNVVLNRLNIVTVLPTTAYTPKSSNPRASRTMREV